MTDAQLHGRCPHAFVLDLCPECAPPKPERKASRGDARRFSHPGFQDMTGKVLAGCTVLRRAANVNGNARWLVRAACGHEVILDGIALRAKAKAGQEYRCKACRPKRPGTVRARRG